MGVSTFSGPIRAGNIPNTTGTTLGNDVRNVGFVVMVQHVPVTQAATATAQGTAIVLPANSHILSIQMLTTAAWSGAAQTISIGTTATSTELVSGASLASVGINVLTPGTDPTRTAAWDDTGTADRRIFALSANTGTGVGTLTVRYIQAHDLP
ncbi:hypothetical protein UFOVP330_59 [uncultured Caudovirales phage]|uniref:Uncharacterized protein n=1 Tax=uncultured Caudovirales phage TaxID=2100421 RepID=A0A6J5LWI3_9CAUD|nr:hypothetical protein UFOVP330_59 [uncultured Caudovirales phage]